MNEATRFQNWFDVLSAFIEGKMLFADGSRPDDADRMIAIGIVLAFEKAMQRTMQVSIPTLEMDVAAAISGTDRDVNLFVNGRQLARVMASDTQTAQNAYNRSVALGVGK